MSELHTVKQVVVSKTMQYKCNLIAAVICHHITAKLKFQFQTLLPSRCCCWEIPLSSQLVFYKKIKECYHTGHLVLTFHRSCCQPTFDPWPCGALSSNRSVCLSATLLGQPRRPPREAGGGEGEQRQSQEMQQWRMVETCSSSFNPFILKTFHFRDIFTIIMNGCSEGGRGDAWCNSSGGWGLGEMGADDPLWRLLRGAAERRIRRLWI